MSNYNFNMGYGRHWMDSFPSKGGRVFFVVSSSDDRYDMISNIVVEDPTGKVRLFTSIESAYAAATDGANDTIYYLAGPNSQTLTAQLVWAKDYCHLIGVCAPVGPAKRARIFMTSTVATSPMIDITTAEGCIFKDFYIFHGIADAAALGCVRLASTAMRNYFENVHFAGIGNATQDAAGAYSLFLDGAAENLFVNCQIGLDTIARGTGANSEILVDTAATRNEFRDCLIYAWIEATTHPLVKLADATSIDRYLTFKNCLFLNESENYGTTSAGIFKLTADLTQGFIMVINCVGNSGSSSATKWDVDDRDKIYLFNAPTPAADTAGLTRNV